MVPQSQAEPDVWWRRLWPFAAQRRARRRIAHALYGALVAQARSPALYRELGVPDTAEGRYEMVALHAVLVIRMLRRHGAEGEALAQELFEVMFGDMDRSLREMGVGDLSVGKYVKGLAGRLFGHSRRLQGPLDAGDRDALVPLLAGYVYDPRTPVAAGAAEALAAYLLAQERWLAARPGEEALAGRVHFAPVTP